MREAIYERLVIIRAINHKFSPRLMRFRNAEFNNVHLSEIKFGSNEDMNEYSDEELLALYEKIIRLTSKQF